MRYAQEKYRDPVQDAIKTGLRASCTLYVSEGKKFWTGSGFHVGHGMIITASHVCPPGMSPAADITVTFDGRSMYPAELVVSSSQVDAAVLKLRRAPAGIGEVQLGNSNLVERGEIVAVISSPEGYHDSVTVGRVSNVHQALGKYAPSAAWNDIIFIDADVMPGSSGGMVIGTDHRVIGLVMGVTGEFAEVGVGERSVSPSNKILALLAEANAKVFKASKWQSKTHTRH